MSRKETKIMKMTCASGNLTGKWEKGCAVKERRDAKIRLGGSDQQSCVIKPDTFPRGAFSTSPGTALPFAKERNTRFPPGHNNLYVMALSPIASCD